MECKIERNKIFVIGIENKNMLVNCELNCVEKMKLKLNTATSFILSIQIVAVHKNSYE